MGLLMKRLMRSHGRHSAARGQAALLGTMRLSAPGAKNAKFDQKLIESISFSNRIAECARCFLGSYND
jgi:hypothetical protein